MGCVYKITNQVNNKAYIGYTIRTAEQRWQQHVNCAFNPQTKDGSYDHALKRAIRKYGPQNFLIEVIESNDDKQYLAAREKYWIKYYKTCTLLPDSHGYNLTIGGDGGNGQYKSIYRIDIPTGTIEAEYYSEQQAIQQEHNTTIANVINHPYQAFTANGKTFMEKNVVDSMSKEELIDYLYTRYNFVCQYDTNGKLLNYFQSIEQASKATGVSKATISQALCGTRKHGGQFQWCYYKDRNEKDGHVIFNFNGEKAVIQFDLNGQELCRFNSAKEAANRVGCDASGIGKVCKGKRKTCGGFKWRYDTE